MNLPGGELEYAVLTALWDKGEATGRDVHDVVGEPRGLVYTTTAKVLDRLREKGLIRRRESGKTFTYRALVARQVVLRARAREAVKSVLGDEPRPAVAALVDAVESVDPALLDELERLVAQRRAARGGPRRGS
jgi:BlaI family penicillinase repressor